jgi:Ca2+-binding RTX toxin-like protein
VAVTIWDDVANDGNSVDLGDGAESGRRDLILTGIEALRGTDHADHLVDATIALPIPSARRFNGLGGDDILVGEDGADVLIGDEGNDLILGQTGNDRLFGDAGDDELKGKEGDDGLTGGLDADTLDGGPDADALRGEPGDDILLARDGLTDDAECGEGADSVTADQAGVDGIASDCESIAFAAQPTSPLLPPSSGAVQGAANADSGCAQLRKKLKKTKSKAGKRKLRRKLRKLGC